MYLDQILDPSYLLLSFLSLYFLNYRTMILNKLLPVWYGGGILKNRNAFDKRRTPKLLRVLYYPKLSNYEHKTNYTRNIEGMSV